MMATAHRILDHATGIILEVTAPTEGELYAETTRAVVAIMTGGAPIAEGIRRDVTIEAADRYDLFVRWVNEVIALATNEGFFISRCEATLTGWTNPPRAFARPEPDGCSIITAAIWGKIDCPLPITTTLKRATDHDLVIADVEGGVRAQVVIEI